jgi:hypothetical protein
MSCLNDGWPMTAARFAEGENGAIEYRLRTHIRGVPPEKLIPSARQGE